MHRNRWSGPLRRLLLLAALGGAAVLPPGRAHAEVTAEELKEARKLFQRGLELEQAGNWAGALQLFREVSQVKMTPQVRFHIAACEENLGKLVAALGGYELALADADAVGEAFRTDVEDKIDRLRARIPKLVIERGPGAKAAAIELDGIALGSSSIGVEVPIDPGPHQVTAEAKGYEDYSSTVEVDEQETETLVVEMVEVPTDVAPPRPHSSVTDGAPQEHKSKLLPISLMAGGGGFLALSAVFYLQRNIALGERRDICPNDRCGVLDDDERAQVDEYDKSAHTNSTLSAISGVVGLGAVGAGITLLVLDAREDHDAGKTKKPKTKQTERDRPGKKRPDMRKKHRANLWWSPTVPQGEVGLTFGGSF